jgi:hypothetical protein
MIVAKQPEFNKDALSSAAGMLQYSTGIVLAALAFSLTLPGALPLLSQPALCWTQAAWGLLYACWLFCLLSLFFGVGAWTRIMALMIKETGGPSNAGLTSRTLCHLIALGLAVVALMAVLVVGFLWKPKVTTPTQAIAAALSAIDVGQRTIETTSVDVITFADAHSAMWRVTVTLARQRGESEKPVLSAFVEPATGTVTCVPKRTGCSQPTLQR